MGDSTIKTIGIIGAGSWGTSLAVQLSRNGHEVFLWGNDPEHQAALIQQRCNDVFLPGIRFPEKLYPVAELRQCLSSVDDILLVVPSHAFKSVLSQIMPDLSADMRIAWATKGLEPGSAQLLHVVANELLAEPRPLAVISGPTFAMEVAQELPTAMVVASEDQQFAHDMAEALHSEACRVYLSDDMTGVAIGGAMKNVYAIAAGIADGLGYGANTRAALLTRALAEMTRLGVAAGGHAETFTGLTGLGDLILTCTDNQSRNRRFGLALAKEHDVDKARSSISQVVEGIGTAHEVMSFAQRYDIELPICSQVYKVLFEGVSPQQGVRALLARENLQNE